MSYDAISTDMGFLASDTNLDPYGLVAGTDKQYTAMKLNGSQVTPVTAIGDEVVGVLQGHPGAGEAAAVRVSGVSKVKAGGAVDAGAAVYILADGTCVNLATAAVGARFLGMALESGVSGDIVAVMLGKLDATTAVKV